MVRSIQTRKSITTKIAQTMPSRLTSSTAAGSLGEGQAGQARRTRDRQSDLGSRLAPRDVGGINHGEESLPSSLQIVGANRIDERIDGRE